MKKGRAGTMTHDYVRNGTTTLFAALNILDGTVIGQCMQRHRAQQSARSDCEAAAARRRRRGHQELIRFLNQVEAAVPAGKLVHAILDKSAVILPPRPRRPQAPQSPCLARPPPPLDLSLHAYLLLPAAISRWPHLR